jgi:GTP-binding protein YchF
MSSLKVGIVGLPNVGKSTLFNALLKKQQAYVANFPFATIEPNIGVVPVPDERLPKLAEVTKVAENLEKLPPEIYATVEFVDIAGLIAGASKGEGLGNKFLSHIRETNAICHVVRSFSDEDIVKQGVTDPLNDLDTIETELKLADLQTLENQRDPGNSPDKELKKRWEVTLKLKEAVQKNIAARDVELSEEEAKIARQLSLLSAKPVLVVMNVDEKDLINAHTLEAEFAHKLKLNADQVVAISAKTESELSELSAEDQIAYLKDLGVEKSGLERLIKKAFKTLGLITFLTAGEKEVRAWTIKEGINAPEAAGTIHTDFIKKFIKADVCDFGSFSSLGGWKAAREAGKVRSEGKEYVIRDGDVVEFKIGA